MVNSFVPPEILRNPHAMTIAANFWPRSYPGLGSASPRFFQVDAESQVRGDCHWQQNPREHPTLVLLHGLEGSSASGYMMGTAEKAWMAGFNVVRLNQRNCGGTEALTPTLYHSGMSGDVQAVIAELAERDRLPEIFAAGFSMGGNLVLKMAGELGDGGPRVLRAIFCLAPALDLAACADALDEPRNFIYEWHFVRRLKRRMRHKASLFPEKFPAGELRALREVRSVRNFDDVMTARFCGFRDAADYYQRSSAKGVAGQVRRPTKILTAQDDPFVPFASFQFAALLGNPHIRLEAPKNGGHCAFISKKSGRDRYWAETQIVEFCAENSAYGK
ncbi:MAG: YheT family hydrolase [Candidatus Acidiferrales bacterium]